METTRNDAGRSRREGAVAGEAGARHGRGPRVRRARDSWDAFLRIPGGQIEVHEEVCILHRPQSGQTEEPIYDRTGTLTYGVDSLVTQVALRNNPRF